MPAPVDRHFGKPSFKWLVVLTILVGLSAWTYLRRQEVTSWSGPTMGTRYTVKLATAVTEAHRAAVIGALDAIDQAASTYLADSDVSRFNAGTSTAGFAVAAAVLEIVEISGAVSQASGGAFDITVKPLVDAWGFGPDGRPKHAPSDQRISELLAKVGWRGAAVVKGQLRKSAPALTIDLSAVAKGYAVDQVARALEALGVGDYMIEVGGEVRARGESRDSQPWRIGIERPDGRGAVAAVVALDGEALATSGDYRSFWVDDDGRRYGHTIDPRTGSPVGHGLRSVSVIHETCAVADAWATALMVLGPAEGLRTARREGLAVLLVVEDGSGNLAVRSTAAFDRHVLR